MQTKKHPFILHIGIFANVHPYWLHCATDERKCGLSLRFWGVGVKRGKTTHFCGELIHSFDKDLNRVEGEDHVYFRPEHGHFEIRGYDLI